MTTAKYPNFTKYYDPAVDFLGPYNFRPPNCYTAKRYKTSNIFGLPLIGYIERNNTIQEDLIKQLQLIFSDQIMAYNFSLNFFNSTMVKDFEVDPEKAMPFMRSLYGINMT